MHTPPLKNHWHYTLYLLILLISSCSPTPTDTTHPQIERYLQEAENSSLSKTLRTQKLDSAYQLCVVLDNYDYKKKKLSDISIYFYKMKEYKRSNTIDKELLSLSLKFNDSIGIAEALNYLAVDHRRNNQLDSAYFYFYKALNIYQQLEQSDNYPPKAYAYRYGATLIGLTQLSRKAKEYFQSEAYATKAIQQFELVGNNTYLPTAYITLGIIAKQLERYPAAIGYYQKAMQLAKGVKKDALYGVLGNNNIGTVYKSSKQYDKAKAAYRKGLSYTKFLETDPERYALLLDNLGYVLFLANKHNDSSLYLYNKAYKIRDSVKDHEGLATNHLHFAYYYQAHHKDSLAIYHALQAKVNANIIQSNTDLLETYRLLIELSEGAEAKQYALQHIQLRDSILKKQRLYKDKFARIRFETEEKEARIRQVSNQNTIYLLGIVLLLVGIGFAIYFFRQRTHYLGQQNKIIQLQTSYETETRIAKRLHDELGNAIFQVMLHHEQDPQDPQIAEKLNTAYHKARDISRENSEFEVGSAYLEELTEMLKNYTQNDIRLILRGTQKINWDTVDKTIKIAVYRVLQELMTNMQKHSKASLVAIVFATEKQQTTIKYSDNGVGIDLDCVLSKNGLRNIERRIQNIGGTLTFESQPKKGFSAHMKIPC